VQGGAILLDYCAIRLKPDTEYGRFRTLDPDESGHGLSPVRGRRLIHHKRLCPFLTAGNGV
jgi:hypothetical protein